jgi:hypothetical protein
MFDGFPTPTKNFFSMPNNITDIIAEITNMAELKVIIYVIRHTWGFHEFGKPKAISVDEFMNGRRRDHGKSRMDNGTGMSNHSVIDGLKKAVEHGYLLCEIDTSDMARVKKSYSLKMAGEQVAPSEDASPPANVSPGEESTSSSEASSPSYEESAHPGEEPAYRSEKDTSRKTLQKDTVERQRDVSGEIVEPAASDATASPAPLSSQDVAYSLDAPQAQEEQGEPGRAHDYTQPEDAPSEEKPAEKPKKRTRTPKAPKVDPATLQLYRDVFDDCRREALADESEGYAHTGASDKEIETLLEANRSRPGFVTPQRLHKVYVRLWNLPRDERTGYYWREHMSIRAICHNYEAQLTILKVEAQTKQQQAQTTEADMKRQVAERVASGELLGGRYQIRSGAGQPPIHYMTADDRAAIFGGK